MADIATLLYQFLTQQFSKQDWNPGSVIRELVAEPLVKLSEQAETAINTLYNSVDIQLMLENPEQYDAEIDALFESMGLSAPAARESRGSVRLLVEGGDAFAITSGVNFSYENINLAVTDNYYATVDPGAETAAIILPLKQVQYNTYEVIVPVTAVGEYSGLSEGVELSWTGVTANVYSASVYSAITGGVSPYTATQKLNMIRQALVPQSLTCREGLVRTLNSEIPDLVVDCLPKQNSTGGAVQLYTKTTAAPQTWTLTDILAEPVYNTGEDTSFLQKGRFTIPSTGIYSVVKVIDANYHEEHQILDVQIDGRYVVVDYATDTETPEPLTVEVFGLSQLKDAQATLDRYTANTGVRINVVPPRLLQLSMYLPTTGNINTTAMTDIVSAVNNSLLNVSVIGDSTVTPLLAKYNLSLQGTGTYTLKDMVTGRTLSSLSNINPTPFLTTAEPYAIYTALDLIDYAQTV